MRTSTEIVKLTEALNKVQGEISGVPRDSTNPFFRSKYADLTAVWGASRDCIVKNGFVVIQTPSCENGSHYLTTRLQHTSGEFIEDTMMLVLAKADMQGLGSAITYARRYALMSILGLCPEDDDGNLASGTKGAKKENSISAGVEADLPPVINKATVLNAAKTLFGDPDKFKAWRVDEGLCEDLKTAKVADLEKIMVGLTKLAKSGAARHYGNDESFV